MISVCVSRLSTNQPVWNSRTPWARVPAVEDVEHHEERGVVEDRRARADEDDEARELRSMSHGRGLAICSGSTSSVGIAVWRDVVEQVVGQDLDRRHRQERHEDARSQHAEHVAEVAARAHAGCT